MWLCLYFPLCFSSSSPIPKGIWQQNVKCILLLRETTQGLIKCIFFSLCPLKYLKQGGIFCCLSHSSPMGVSSGRAELPFLSAAKWESAHLTFRKLKVVQLSIETLKKISFLLLYKPLGLCHNTIFLGISLKCKARLSTFIILFCATCEFLWFVPFFLFVCKSEVYKDLCFSISETQCNIGQGEKYGEGKARRRRRRENTLVVWVGAQREGCFFFSLSFLRPVCRRRTRHTE